jgi:hypothetical protein
MTDVYFNSLPAREVEYCCKMMLSELAKLRRGGDTRAYLSLDLNDEAVVTAALQQMLAGAKVRNA